MNTRLNITVSGLGYVGCSLAVLLSQDHLNTFDIEAHMRKVPMQPGDVPTTYASTEKLEADYGYTAETDLREGLRRFAAWYGEYSKIR